MLSHSDQCHTTTTFITNPSSCRHMQVCCFYLFYLLPTNVLFPCQCCTTIFTSYHGLLVFTSWVMHHLVEWKGKESPVSILQDMITSVYCTCSHFGVAAQCFGDLSTQCSGSQLSVKIAWSMRMLRYWYCPDIGCDVGAAHQCIVQLRTRLNHCSMPFQPDVCEKELCK